MKNHESDHMYLVWIRLFYVHERFQRQASFGRTVADHFRDYNIRTEILLDIFVKRRFLCYKKFPVPVINSHIFPAFSRALLKAP